MKIIIKIIGLLLLMLVYIALAPIAIAIMAVQKVFNKGLDLIETTINKLNNL